MMKFFTLYTKKKIMPISETMHEVSSLKMSSLKSYNVGRSLISYEYFYLSGGLSDGGSNIDI
jgi:hypothetical protein